MSSEQETTEGQEAEENQEPSIRDTMEEVYDKIMAEEADAAPESDEGGTDEAPDESETEGEDKESELTASQEEGTGGLDDADGEDTPDDQDGDQEEQVTVPEDWSAEEKATFEALPEEAKGLVLGMQKNLQAGFTAKSQELGEHIQTLEPIAQTVKQNKGYLDSIGVDAGQAFDALIGIERTLRNGTAEQKRAQVEDIIKTYGIDMGQGQQAEPEDDPFTDPTVKALTQKVDDLTNKLTERDKQDAQNAAQARRNEVQREWQDLIDAKNEDGSSKHPHVDKLKTNILNLVRASEINGQRLSFEDAYGQAVHANPETRQILQKEAQEKARQKEQQDKVEKARKAKKATRPKIGNAPSKNHKPQTMRETMEEVYDRMTS